MQLAYCEIMHRDVFEANDKLSSMVISDRLRKLAEIGQLLPPLELGIDAGPVYATVEVADPKDPQECSVKIRVLSLREAIRYGRL